MSRAGARQGSGESETNARLVITALGAVIVSLVLFWVAEHESWFTWSEPVRVTLEQVAGLVLASGLLATAWELVGKRRFALEVLAKARLSADVVDAGIARVANRYNSDVDWSSLFSGAKELDMVVAYARTWRNDHREELTSLVTRPGGRLRVYLPDPDDAATMAVLGDRFSTTGPELAATVREAVREYSDLRRGDGTGVEVWVRPGDAVFSAYRFDHRVAVMTLYSHGKKRRTSVPTFVVGRGQLLGFVSEELDAIQDQSRRIYPPAVEEGKTDAR